jgi:phosphopantetheinyl transferase
MGQNAIMNPSCEVLRFTTPVHDKRWPAAVGVARIPDISRWSSINLDRWLGPTEKERFHGFKVDHARADFLAGRVAAKSALRAIAADTKVDDWGIERGIWHQPRPRGPLAGLGVTLAHSCGLAVAVAFDDRWICGIDLESNERVDVEAIATQVSVEEANWARECDENASDRWLFLWTAREAQGKARGCGLLFPEALSPTVSRIDSEHGWESGLSGTDLLGARCVRWNKGVLSIVAPVSSLRDSEFTSVFSWIHRAVTRI